MKQLSLVLCLLACSWCLAAGPLTMSHRQAKYSDAEIEATIKAKLAKSKIGKDGFQVHVKDGVATWAGSTSVMQHKGAATRMAKAAGAIQVVNNIKVLGDGAVPGKPGVAGPPRHVQVKSAASGGEQ
ncbi:MAG TPA: BON domain-containing protein [Bryobacteraceae bacterium]|nr:BON domain-containing protein [Bryobacteraceae bacterium]